MSQSGTQFGGYTPTDFVTCQGICNTGKMFVTMTTGATATIPNNMYRVFLRGTLLILAYTIQLPVTNALMDGKTILFISNVAISAITLKAGSGDTIADALASIGVSQRFGYTYDLASLAWYRSS